MKLLFICEGNVARSQEAAAFWQQLHPEDEVVSAGTKAIIGKPIHPFVLEVMHEEGIELTDVYRKAVTPAMVASADRVISFVSPDELPEYAATSSKLELWPVPDPRHQPIETHRAVRDEVKRRVAEDDR